jgi:hypothetical protein
VGQSLDLLNFSKSTLKTKGNMSYIVLTDDQASSWIAHISNQLVVSNNSKVDFDIDSHKTGHMVNIKYGSDLSYRKIILDCLNLNCYQENLKSVEVNFYNQNTSR